MDWNQITELAVLLDTVQVTCRSRDRGDHRPTIAASSSALAMFKRRVGGVYFAIITQALAAVLTILIIGRQGYTPAASTASPTCGRCSDGISGPTAPNYILYFVCCFLLLGTMFLARFVATSKLGRILVATRDKEDRVRFSGYDVANLQDLRILPCVAMAAIGGAMFTLQVGFMSPSFVGIVPSIEMVIFCAVGGRHSIVGACSGRCSSTGARPFSESFPELWLFAMGGLFIAVVLAFPRGLPACDRPDHSRLNALAVPRHASPAPRRPNRRGDIDVGTDFSSRSKASASRSTGSRRSMNSISISTRASCA
jgi:urea transport system permease protein